MLVAGESVHQLFFLFKGCDEAHLAHELDAALQSEGAVALVGIEVQFGRHLHAAQLAVDECGGLGRIDVRSAVVEAHGAGAAVKLEHLAQLHVAAIALAGGGCAALGVGGAVGRRIDYGPVDVA